MAETTDPGQCVMLLSVDVRHSQSSFELGLTYDADLLEYNPIISTVQCDRHLSLCDCHSVKGLLLLSQCSGVCLFFSSFFHGLLSCEKFPKRIFPFHSAEWCHKEVEKGGT